MDYLQELQPFLGNSPHNTQAKMKFLFKSIDDGWTVRKKNGRYIFIKPNKEYITNNDNKFITESTYLDTVP